MKKKYKSQLTDKELKECSKRAIPLDTQEEISFMISGVDDPLDDDEFRDAMENAFFLQEILTMPDGSRIAKDESDFEMLFEKESHESNMAPKDTAEGLLLTLKPVFKKYKGTIEGADRTLERSEVYRTAVKYISFLKAVDGNDPRNKSMKVLKEKTLTEIINPDLLEGLLTIFEDNSIIDRKTLKPFPNYNKQGILCALVRTLHMKGWTINFNGKANPGVNIVANTFGTNVPNHGTYNKSQYPQFEKILTR